MALFHKAITRYALPALLALCVLIFPSCEREHDELSFTNPMDPRNPVTHGDPYDVRVQAKDKSITVQWDKLSDVDGFVVYRSTSPDGGFEQIGTSASSEYEDADAPPGVTYYYQIRGYQGSTERQSIPSQLTGRSHAAIKSPPDVKLTSNYAPWERGILKIEAQATDIDGDVQHVRFEYSLNGEIWSEIATDTVSPYTVEWDTTSVIETLDDSVWVKATATDNESLTSERAIDEPFGVDNEPPWIARWYLTPDDVTEDTSGTLRILVQVSDGDGSGLAKSAPQLDYRIGENSAYDGYKAMTLESKDLWRYDLPEPSQGWDGYRGEYIYYKATLKDALGNEATGKEQNELIDDINDPPSVLITTSYDEWERGTLTVSAEASDDEGAVTVRFEYSFDKSAWIRIGSPDSSEPYSVTWNTRQSVPEKARTVWLRATATDDGRQSAVYAIPNSFSVDNQPPIVIHDYDGLWRKENFVIELQADDYDGVGMGSIFYILNKGGKQERQINGQGSVSVSITTEGSEKTLEYWCSDKLGNENLHEILSGIKLDRTAPAFSDWEQIADLSEDTSGGFSVSVRITDDGSGLGDEVSQLDYRIGTDTQYDGYEDMTSADGSVWSFEIPEPSDGWNAYRGERLYYKVSSVDVASNEKESAEQTELIDRMNDPPMITSNPVITATEDQPYTYNVEASDTDGDTLTYILISAPSGMSMSLSTGMITWTPTNDDVDKHDVVLTVSDGRDDGIATQSFSITVINVNDDPVITSTAATEATEDELYTYAVKATDPDIGDVLTYSLIAAPSSMSMDENIGMLTWTPTNDDVNQHTVLVAVSDGNNGSATQSFSVTVINVNDLPEITSEAVTVATEDATYSYDVDATDPDVGDALNYSLNLSPSNMSINSSTGMIMWTPTNDDVAVHSVIVSVEDREGGSDTQSFSIAVSDVNDAPTVELVSSFGEWESGILMLEAEGSDIDGIITEVQFAYSPSRAVWLPIGAAITIPPYSIAWDTRTSIPEVAEVVWIKATATDDDGHSAEFTIPRSLSVDNQSPITIEDYNNLWHNRDFFINLTPGDGNGIGVASVSYRFNSGQIQDIPMDGRISIPVLITTEGPDNILEYWSTDGLGNVGIHQTLAGIKLDKTAPVFSVWQQNPVDLTEDTVGRFQVSVQVTDEGGSGLEGKIPQLDYHIGTETQYNGYENMTGGSWLFNIPEPEDTWDAHQGQNVHYKVRVEDIAGNVTETLEERLELIDSVNDAPVVDITSTFKEWEGDEIIITAQASDVDSSAPSVQFEYSVNAIDWMLVGVTSAIPPSYSIAWQTKIAIPELERTVWIKAKAIDADDTSVLVEDIISRSFGVDNQPSTFGNWTQTPSDLTENTDGSFRVQVNVDDSIGSGVEKVEFVYRIGNRIVKPFNLMVKGAGNSWYFDIPEPSNSWDAFRGETLFYSAVATDIVGNESPQTEEQEELIDGINDAPRGVITSTFKDWERGTLTLLASAIDDDGQVVGVQFQYSPDNVNWINIGSMLLSIPYTTMWDSTSINMDPNIWLQIVVTDNDNASTSWPYMGSIGIDNAEPIFGNWSHTALTEDSDETFFRVEVEAADQGSGIDSNTVQVNYRIGLSGYVGYTNMFRKPDDVWFYDIPRPSAWSNFAGETFFYKVRAADIAGNTAESAEQKELIEPTTGSISGNISPRESWQFGNAKVKAIPVQQVGQEVQIPVSATNGSYSITGLRPGLYDLEVTSLGYGTDRSVTNVQITAGESSPGHDVTLYTYAVAEINRTQGGSVEYQNAQLREYKLIINGNALGFSGKVLLGVSGKEPDLIPNPEVQLLDVITLGFQGKSLNSPIQLVMPNPGGIVDGDAIMAFIYDGKDTSYRFVDRADIASNDPDITITITPDNVQNFSDENHSFDEHLDQTSDTVFYVVITRFNEPQIAQSQLGIRDPVIAFGRVTSYGQPNVSAGDQTIAVLVPGITSTPDDLVNLIDDLEDLNYYDHVLVFNYKADSAIGSNANFFLSALGSLSNQFSGKVDVVAHGMGGLVARGAIVENGDDYIGSLTMLGVPHGGVDNTLLKDGFAAHMLKTQSDPAWTYYRSGWRDMMVGSAFLAGLNNQSRRPVITHYHSIATFNSAANDDLASLVSMSFASFPNAERPLTEAFEAIATSLPPEGLDFMARTRHVGMLNNSIIRDRVKLKLQVAEAEILQVAEAEMVLIPAGEFEMGTDESEMPGLVEWTKKWQDAAQARWYEDETPRHTIHVDAFYMDIYEVTNAQYEKFMNATGHSAPRYWSNASYNAPEQPVVGVSWNDAVAYAEWAGKRLPTEAQWEKAAQGGLAGRRFPWGDGDPDGAQCNFADVNTDYSYSDDSVDDGYEYAAPVGSYLPNSYGLYDMAGNVLEWCADWYDSGYYANSPYDNPLGPDSGTVRVLRGGSWHYAPSYLRVALRFTPPPAVTYADWGFRCVSQD